MPHPAPATARLQLFQAATPATRTAARKQHSTVTVDGSATGWTTTGVTVSAGDPLTFQATGQIQLAGHTLTADGMVRGWRDMLRHFPVDSANAGALVGRIGNSAASVPFAVGSSSTVTAPADGELYLRINTSQELSATGSFRTDVRVGTTAPTNFANALHARAAFTPALLTGIDTLPRRVADRDGTPGDAINFALVGTEAQVRSALARSGWIEVDADASAAVVHGLLNTLEHKPYVEVPMSTLYLFGRPQDFGFARASAITVASDRHHLRCWLTTLTVNGTPVWVGAATHDIGLERDERNGDLTHRIAPEIDLERDFLRDSFLGSGSALTVAYFTPLDPIHSARTATGGSFTTDGRMLLLTLR